MKVLVTGSKGMLGSNFVKHLKGCDVIGYGKEELDITNFNSVKSKVCASKIDTIIHTAAFTDVEKCELQPDLAYRVNTIGTQNVVNAALSRDIFFVYISSTGVYGNYKSEPFSEYDKVKPTTIHHKSKLEAEKIVRDHLNKFLIIRTGWLFGGDREHSKNFVYKRYLEAKNNDTISSDDNQIGNPTYILDVIKQVEFLVKNNFYGIFNCVNSGFASRYEYVKQIVNFFGLNCTVRVAPKGTFKRVAPVSFNESAINYKMDLMNINYMGDWKESLLKYINQLK